MKPPPSVIAAATAAAAAQTPAAPAATAAPAASAATAAPAASAATAAAAPAASASAAAAAAPPPPPPPPTPPASASPAARNHGHHCRGSRHKGVTGKEMFSKRTGHSFTITRTFAQVNYIFTKEKSPPRWSRRRERRPPRGRETGFRPKGKSLQ